MKDEILASDVIVQDIALAPGLYRLQEFLLPYVPLINFIWSGLFMIVLLGVIFYYIIAPYLWPNESEKKHKND